MNKLSNIFLGVSAVLILVTVVLVVVASSSTETEAPLPKITTIRISSDLIDLERLLTDTKGIKSTIVNGSNLLNQEIVLIHTLRALSCSNCVFDTKLLTARLDSIFPHIPQIIWYIDDQNPYSFSVARSHSGGRTYLIGNDISLNPLFLSDTARIERILLVFVNGRLSSKIILPYKIEFYEANDRETILNTITKEVQNEITN